jgi:putative DNA methylase
VYYSVLADFFFAWKRLLLQIIEPELFKTETTDFSRELVASTRRSGTPESAHSDYVEQLMAAIKEAERVLKPDGVFAFIYTHSSLNGWKALVQAYRPTTLFLSSVQPLSIERRQRPRAINSEAVNTCISFVARKSEAPKTSSKLAVICDSLRTICNGDFVSELSRAGWHNSDIAIAAYAHGPAMLANVETLANGETILVALAALEKVVQERFSSFTLTKRRSL